MCISVGWTDLNGSVGVSFRMVKNKKHGHVPKWKLESFKQDSRFLFWIFNLVQIFYDFCDFSEKFIDSLTKSKINSTIFNKILQNFLQKLFEIHPKIDKTLKNFEKTLHKLKVSSQNFPKLESFILKILQIL